MVWESVGRTSFLVTGFSSNDRWVSRGRSRKGSRSASSAKLFAVRTRVVRLGRFVARFDWMVVRRLRARRRVRRRGEFGKLERETMSLSVKSIASCGWDECVSSCFEAKVGWLRIQRRETVEEM